MNKPPPSAADRLRQGHALQMQGKLSEAGAIYREVLDQEPRNAPALHLMGVLALQAGQLEPGIDLIRQSLAILPGFAPAHDNLGKGLERLGRTEEALTCYGKVIALAPGHAEGYANRARVLERLGRYEEALKDLDKALSLKGDPELALNRGAVLLQLGRHEEALSAFDKSIAMGLTHPVGRFNRGLALMQLDRHEEALAAYDDAIARQPEYADAFVNRGLTLETLGRVDEALASFDQALAINSDLQEGYLNRGALLSRLGRAKEAVAAYDAMLSRWPDDASAYNNRGAAQKSLDAPEKALADFERAIALQSGDANLHDNRGNALQALGRFDQAMAAYDQALALDPNSERAAFSKSTLLLLQGRFAEGWPLYQTRPRLFLPPALDAAKAWEQRQTPVAGKRVLVYDDQGMGDVIQFARFLSTLKDLGAAPVLMVRASMLRLLQGLDPAVTLARMDEAALDHDLHAPLASLPYLLGVTDIPARESYLAAEPERAAKWKKKIGARGLRIGVCWQGKTGGRNDAFRSFPLAALAPLAALPGVRLISLQKGEGEEQLAELEMKVEELSGDFDAGADAFVDSAAAMASLDLVISCDTSVAHLAGALGRPVWVALKQVPEWRWQLERGDSPWYPSMTLFRQPRRGDWEHVFTAMAERLKSGLASRA